MPVRLLLAILALVPLAGCATLSQNECLSSDWHAIGYEDGVRGVTADHVGRHRRACARHGVSPDFGAWQQGWNEGLGVFCHPQNGFNHGSRGGTYAGQCPADLDAEFSEAWHAGRHLYELRSGVTTTASRIATRRADYERLGRKLRDAEARLVGDEATREERAELLDEVRELARERGQLEVEIVELEREQAVREEQLEAYRASLFDYPGY